MSLSVPAAVPYTQPLLAVFSTTLLRKIFKYVCDAVHLPFRPADSRAILSLVCQRWVNIVKSTPELWDTFRFTTLPTTTTQPEHAFLRQFSRICAERCGQNSLNLDMISDGWTVNLVDSIVIPYMHRIRSLRCLIYGDVETMRLLNVEGQFSVLEFIEILFLNEEGTPMITLPLADSFSLPINAFFTAPRLHKAIMHFENNLQPDSLPLPWGQLTSLDLGTVVISPEACIELLDTTALRLADAFLCVKFVEPIHPYVVLWKRKVTMYALGTLRLTLLFPSVDMRLFSLVRFPSLKNLWIQMHDTFQHWNLSLYTKLLRASTNSLRQLFLSDLYSPGFGMMPEQALSDDFVAQYRHCDTTHHALERLFKVIRNVEELHLPISVHVDAHTVEEIASCALLPRLHSLDLGILDAPQIIFMARRRGAHAFNIPPGPPSTSHPSGMPPFRQHRYTRQRPQTCISFIHMLIPRSAYTEEERMCLIKAAQALKWCGITCCVQTTSMLPLP